MFRFTVCFQIVTWKSCRHQDKGGSTRTVMVCYGKSLKVLKVEVKVILKRVLAVILLKLCLKLIASEEKNEKN